MQRSLTSLVIILFVAVVSPVGLLHALDDTALTAYQSTFAREICKDGAAWMRCFQLEPTACEATLEPIIGRCVRTVASRFTIPTTNSTDLTKASNEITRCVEQDFRGRYEAFKRTTSECRTY